MLVNQSPVTLKLVGLDGNAFSILGAFSGAARKAGWPQEDIEKVLTEAKSDNYEHLLATIMEHCGDSGLADDDDFDDEICAECDETLDFCLC